MGIAIKVPIFPFHSWVPRVHSDSPTVCSVILGAIALKFAAIVVIKVLYHVFFDELARFSSVITAICLASSVIACAHLFIQDDLKKFFAYFTVLHMNLYMFILLSGTGIKNFVFAIIYHSFMIAVLFFVSDVVKMALGTRKISDLRSINSQLVIVRRVIVIAILMLIGCPFTWGFFIEIITMYSAYKISSILVAGSGLVILVSSARAFLTYYGVFGSWKENNSIPANQTDNPFTYGVSREIVLAVLFGTILFFGFTPHLFLESIK
jgi:NADH-quinone oxidoreductase subunit M